jgi:hypothetical protein
MTTVFGIPSGLALAERKDTNLPECMELLQATVAWIARGKCNDNCESVEST